MAHERVSEVQYTPERAVNEGKALLETLGCAVYNMSLGNHAKKVSWKDRIDE